MNQPFFFQFRSSTHAVYPETKGVPLEEMDAVFGEGACLQGLRHYPLSSNITNFAFSLSTEEREREEDESEEIDERSELLRRRLPSNHSVSNGENGLERQKEGRDRNAVLRWFNRLVGRSEGNEYRAVETEEG